MLSSDAGGKYLLKLISGCKILLLSFYPTVQKYLLKQSQISLLPVILWLFTSNSEIAILSFFRSLCQDDINLIVACFNAVYVDSLCS